MSVTVTEIPPGSSVVERTVLHVGCGPRNPLKLNILFRNSGWREIRLDIDPAVCPDIIGSITDLSNIETGSVDAVWSSHNIEHLYAHEVPVALREFRRVLKPSGFLLITMPDIEAVAKVIVEQGAEAVLMTSTDGRVPVTPMDMLYGWRPEIAAGRTYMAHRIGFTLQTLGKSIIDAGFSDARAMRGRTWDLWCIAAKSNMSSLDDMLRLAAAN